MLLSQTFSTPDLRLPVRAEQVQLDEGSQLAAARRGNSILLVEDERVSRRALAMLLSRHGYVIDAVGTAEEALQLVQRRGHAPAIVLADLDLPGMSGLDLIDRLAQLDPDAAAVMITASADEAVASKLSRYGAAYMRKPVDFDALLQLLDAIRSPQGGAAASQVH